MKCVPDLERVTSLNASGFECLVRTNFAFMRGSAKIRATIQELVKPSSATLLLIASTVGARAEVRSRVELRAQDNSTIVHWSAEIELSGLLAGAGRGLVEGVVKDIVEKFFSNIRGRASGP